MDGIINSQTDFSLNNNLPEPFLVVTKNLVSFFIQSIFLVQNIWTFVYQSKESSATPVLNKRYFKWAEENNVGDSGFTRSLIKKKHTVLHAVLFAVNLRAYLWS